MRFGLKFLYVKRLVLKPFWPRATGAILDFDKYQKHMVFGFAAWETCKNTRFWLWQAKSIVNYAKCELQAAIAHGRRGKSCFGYAKTL